MVVKGSLDGLISGDVLVIRSELVGNKIPSLLILVSAFSKLYQRLKSFLYLLVAFFINSVLYLKPSLNTPLCTILQP